MAKRVIGSGGRGLLAVITVRSLRLRKHETRGEIGVPLRKIRERIDYHSMHLRRSRMMLINGRMMVFDVWQQ